MVRSYRLLVDLDGDRSFSHSMGDFWGDVKGDVVATRGRSQGSGLYARSVAGSLSTTLRNPDNKYNRRNEQSPIADLLIPGRAVQFRMTDAAQAVIDEPIWGGYLDNITPPARDTGDVTLTASGILGRMTSAGNRAAAGITLPVTRMTNTANRMNAILDAAGILPEERGEIQGRRAIVLHYLIRDEPLRAAHAIEETEGGFIRELRDGRFQHDGVDYRRTAARRNATFTIEVGADAYPRAGVFVPIQNPQENDPFREIANRVTIPIRQYATDASTILWQLPQPVLLSAGRTVTVEANYPPPGVSALGVETWEVLIGGAHYQINTASDGTGTDGIGDFIVTQMPVSGGLSVDFANQSMTNDYWLISMVARGSVLRQTQSVVLHYGNPDSIALYDPQPYQALPQWISNSEDARDYADNIFLRYGEPRARFAFPISLDGGTPNGSALAAVMETSDRVLYSNLGQTFSAFIERLTHRVGSTHTIDLSLSPAEVEGNLFTLGVSRLDGPDVLGR